MNYEWKEKFQLSRRAIIIKKFIVIPPKNYISPIPILKFNFDFRTAGELESDSVALERIREYEDLQQEKPWDTDSHLPDVRYFFLN